MATSAFLQQPEAQTIEQALGQAVALHQAGQLEDAARRYLALLQAQPNHPEANYHLGILAVQTNHFAAALPYFNAALDADPTRGQFWLGYIDALSQAGQQEDARQVLALARRQGLQGDEVDALAARLDSAQPPEPSTTGHRRPPREAMPVASARKSASHKKKQPSPRELDTLLAAFREGRHAEAVALARTMTEQFPQNEFGWKTLGVVYMQLGSCADALEPMKKAAALSPNDVEAHYNLGVTLQGLGRPQEAESSYRRALRINPHYADALCNLGVTLRNLGHPEEAEKNLRKAVRIKPDYAEAHNNLGATLKDLGRLDAAEASCRQALQLQPHNAAAHSNLGNTLQTLGRLDEAEASYRRALEINPSFTEVLGNLGNVFQELGRMEDAEASYRRALEIKPDYVEAHSSLGVVLQKLGQIEQARISYLRALEIRPEYANAHNNLGSIFQEQDQLGLAEACYRRALEIEPYNIKALENLGKLLHEQDLLNEAEACYQRLLKINPEDATAHFQLGRIFSHVGHFEDAEISYQRVLQIMPDSITAHCNLANTLLSLCRPDEAGVSFRRALDLAPDMANSYSNLLYYLALNEKTDAKLLFLEHCRFGEQFEAPLRAHWPRHTHSKDPERCLRIGFVSGDFYNHAVANFIEPVLTQLAGYPQLSLHAYYNNLVIDNVTQRLRGHFAHWHPIVGLSDAALAEKISADGIDILIDLSGHTAKNRLLTFARKPAPIQASWIGYPGTTGLHAVDYYLADRFLLPPGQFDDQFTEKIARLPANVPFLPYELAPVVNALPALSNGYMTFGSFNRPNKLSREVIALWSKLLRALPDSRMLLGAMPTDGKPDALVEWFENEGVARERLDFHPRSNMENYLRLHHQVDICLDTFPYNGGTTTHHALWMGVPTLTLAGAGTPGRVGVAILSQAGLPDFGVEDAEYFVARGVYWSENLVALDKLRSSLRDHLSQSPLRKPEIIAAGLERALRTMWRRWCEGMPAESFEVHLHDVTSATEDADK
ncbi:MAG: tetratricopeptide repeat protein [Hydrogenophilales bacterium]|nr:tetratricopeptide repeat protein [Hydrogenophilales bacterium]